MSTDALFSGNALRTVDGEGRIALPPFVLRALRGRAVLSVHESDPCISGYDEGREAALFADIERRRLRDEADGIGAAAHHCRSRRAFGTAEQASVDACGRLVLPPIVRRRARIGSLALFVGAGGSFEIWNPHVARASGDEALRELAEYSFLQNGIGPESEVLYEVGMCDPRPLAGRGDGLQFGLLFRWLPALRDRLDPPGAGRVAHGSGGPSGGMEGRLPRSFH